MDLPLAHVVLGKRASAIYGANWGVSVNNLQTENIDS